MNEKIYKYPLPFDKAPEQMIELPKNAQILDVEIQNDVICLWAIVDPDAELEERCFILCGTGDTIGAYNGFKEGSIGHVKTLQQPPFVWHIFEHKKPFLIN